LDDRRRDGGTNSTLRTKEQGTHLTLNEHDDDDEFHTHGSLWKQHRLYYIYYSGRPPTPNLVYTPADRVD